MNYKKLPLLTTLFTLLFTVLFFAHCGKKGCTDPNAYNHDSEASRDDGSCIYPPGGVGGGDISDTITSNITSNTTITQSSLICGSISIDAKVTVAAGVTLVMCADASITVNSEASLSVEGTAANPVIIKGTVETPGYWRGLRFRSNNPDNKLIYTEVYHGGGYSTYSNGMVYLRDNAQVTIENSTFGHSEVYGIVAASGTKLESFSNNEFTNNKGPGVYIRSEHIGQLDANSIYSDNNNDGDDLIYVNSNGIANNQTWPATDAPYYINGITNIDANVSVDPGFQAVFASDGAISVDGSSAFSVEGTSADMASFKGKNNAGWRGIRFRSNNTDNKLSYAALYHGGNYSTYNNSMVYLRDDAQVVIENSIFAESQEYGLYASSGTQLPNFSNNTFSDNSGPGLYIRSEHIGHLDAGSTYSDNNNDGDDVIFVSSNTISNNQTWPATDAPYYFNGITNVEAAVSVEPGFQAVFAADGAISVNDNHSLNAIGTSSQMITFTGKVETSGYWRGIRIRSADTKNEFDYVKVAHAGNYGTYNNSNIYLRDNGYLNISNSEVAHSQDCGLYKGNSATVDPDPPHTGAGNNFHSNGGNDYCP